MKKIKHLILVGVALVLTACSGQDEPLLTAPPAQPQVDVKPQPKGKKKKRSSQKSQASAAVSKYAYSGPRMPGLKVSHVSVPGNYVALTFDDGPSATLTPRVLDILNQYGAKATFFVVGRSVQKNSHILARAVAEGHEVGAHTWSHIKMTTSGTSRVISEMDRTNAAIQSATGLMPKVMRPPYGAVNPNIVSLMKSRYGMSTIMWDVDTRDWQHPGVDVVIQRAVGRATPGSIILLHDIHESTLRAVEGIVSGLQARGFRIVTVSQLLALGRHAAQQAAAASNTVAASPAAAEPAPAVAEPAPAPVQAEAPASAPNVEPVTPPAVTPAEPTTGAASISGTPTE